MKNLKRIIVISLIGLFILIAGIVFITTQASDTTLEFKVIDKVSKGWVWDCTITFKNPIAAQNRIIRSYYQTNKGAGILKFTNLQPGTWTMELSAPHYAPVTREITIQGGQNILKDPIEMTGLEIQGLEKFFLFPKYDQENNQINIELRPAKKNDLDKWEAIVNHPTLDILMGCRIHIQIKDGVFVKKPTSQGADRGEQLFNGKLEWQWDASAENIYRYSAILQGTKIKNHISPYRVYDFIILVPIPGKITNPELNNIMNEALSLDEDDVPAFLSQHEEKLTYYIDVSWNVPALQ